jgi:hypothetical protein
LSIDDCGRRLAIGDDDCSCQNTSTISSSGFDTTFRHSPIHTHQSNKLLIRGDPRPVVLICGDPRDLRPVVLICVDPRDLRPVVLICGDPRDLRPVLVILR